MCAEPDLIYDQALQQSSAMQAGQHAVKSGVGHKLLWCDVQQLAGGHGLVHFPEHC